MNLLEIFIILGSIIGSVTFAGGMLWMVFLVGLLDLSLSALVLQ